MLVPKKYKMKSLQLCKNFETRDFILFNFVSLFFINVTNFDNYQFKVKFIKIEIYLNLNE